MDLKAKEQTWTPSSTSPPLALRHDSKKISKPKPKIRIIHIFAPEIIKTDAANFRELVQRLTGKPTEKGCNKIPRTALREESRNESSDKTVAKLAELRAGFRGLESRERVKDEEGGMWNGENSGGFLGGFADLEGFIQELGEFPFLPLDASHMHGFGEAQLA